MEESPVIIQTVAQVVDIVSDAREPILVECRYDIDDPYAIHMTIYLPDDRFIPWVFSRELLSDALLEGSAGAADVRLHVTGDTLRMRLSSPDGTAWLYFDVQAFEEFAEDLPPVPAIVWDDFLKDLMED